MIFFHPYCILNILAFHITSTCDSYILILLDFMCPISTTSYFKCYIFHSSTQVPIKPNVFMRPTITIFYLAFCCLPSLSPSLHCPVPIKFHAYHHFPLLFTVPFLLNFILTITFPFSFCTYLHCPVPIKFYTYHHFSILFLYLPSLSRSY